MERTLDNHSYVEIKYSYIYSVGYKFACNQALHVFQLSILGLVVTAATWLANKTTTHAPVEADLLTNLSLKNFQSPQMLSKQGKFAFFRLLRNLLNRQVKILVLQLISLVFYAWVSLEASDSWQ